MKKMLNNIVKHIFLFLFGGIIYIGIELLYRGYSHWTMFILGGLCFVALGLINELIPWDMPLCLQMFIGGAAITILEYITGYIVNIKLGWDIWDYSDMPYNINGQVCLPFFFVWIGISLIGIIVDDYIRYYFFKESKPKYSIFITK